MNLKIIRYNLNKSKNRWYIPLIVVLLILTITIISTCIPFWVDNGEFVGTIDQSVRNSLLEGYQKSYNQILSTPEEYKRYDLFAQYKLFIETGTVASDYIMWGSLGSIPNHTQLDFSRGFLCISIAKYLSYILSLSLGTFLFIKPLKEGQFKMMTLVGVNKKDILLTNVFSGLLMILTYLLVIFIISICYVGPYFNMNVLMIMNNEAVVIPLYQIYITEVLSLLVISLFTYTLGLYLGFIFKRLSLVVSLPVLSLLVFALISKNSIIRIGSSSESNIISAASYPFINLFYIGQYGCLWQTWTVFGFYALVSVILFSLFINQYKKVDLT